MIQLSGKVMQNVAIPSLYFYHMGKRGEDRRGTHRNDWYPLLKILLVASAWDVHVCLHARYDTGALPRSRCVHIIIIVQYVHITYWLSR